MSDFFGEGGSYIADASGTRIKLLPEWDGALPDFTRQPDMLASLAGGTVDDIRAALPALGKTALATLLELETNGAARVTALEAIKTAQGE